MLKKELQHKNMEIQRANEALKAKSQEIEILRKSNKEIDLKILRMSQKQSESNIIDGSSHESSSNAESMTERHKQEI